MMRKESYIWWRGIRWASPLGFVCLVASGLTISASQPAPRAPRGAEKVVQQRNAGVIVNIEHNGLQFRIAMNPAGDSLLRISIPERDSAYRSSSRPPVRLRVQLWNDAVVEGAAALTPPWVSGGGFVDVAYSFALHRTITMNEIHSVSISIHDQRFTAYPW
jgi:hypothetical protein